MSRVETVRSLAQEALHTGAQRWAFRSKTFNPRTAAAPPVGCLVCGWSGATFEPPLGHCEGNRCPRCGSIGRDRFLLHCLATRCPDRPGLRLLETSPRMGAEYRRAMAKWFRYTASDYDERAHAGTVRLDLQSLDVPDGAFDVICSAHVLEHVPDTDRAIGELWRALSPGGWLFLQVPVLQAATAPPDEPEFHGDRTPVFWRFGPDLTSRLRARGFETELLCVDELRDLRLAGAERWYGPSSPEFDADGLLAAVDPVDLVGVADRAVAARAGFEPAYMYLTWACFRPM